MEKVLTFTSLPLEIRLHILMFTNVFPPSGFVEVVNGQPVTRIYTDSKSEHTTTCRCDVCCHPFPGLDILNVPNTTWLEDAHFIFFTKNRIGFSGHPGVTLKFLQEKQPWIRHLRDVKFFFDEIQFSYWNDDRADNSRGEQEPWQTLPGRHLRDVNFFFYELQFVYWNDDTVDNSRDEQEPWQKLPGQGTAFRKIAYFIKQHVPLDKLSITLDTWRYMDSHMFIGSMETVMRESDRIFYKDFIEPFKGWGEKGLGKFTVLWCRCSEYEQEHEEMVMGSGWVNPDRLSCWQVGIGYNQYLDTCAVERGF